MSYLPSHVLNIRTAFRRHFYRSPVRKGRNKSMKKKMHLAAKEPRTLSVARIPEGLDFEK